jgi:hypothetical protein
MKYPAIPVHTNQITKNSISTTFRKQDRPPFFALFSFPELPGSRTCRVGAFKLDPDNDGLIGYCNNGSKVSTIKNFKQQVS